MISRDKKLSLQSILANLVKENLFRSSLGCPLQCDLGHTGASSFRLLSFPLLSVTALIEALSLPLHACFLNIFDGIWSYLPHTAHPIAWLVFLSFFSILDGRVLSAHAVTHYWSLPSLPFCNFCLLLSCSSLTNPLLPAGPFGESHRTRTIEKPRWLVQIHPSSSSTISTPGGH